MNYAELEKISPVELCRYLHKNGWVVRETNEHRIFHTLVQTDETFEVVVFMDETIRDYPTRVRDVLQTLAVVEGRTPEEIAQGMVYGTDEEWVQRIDYVEKLLPVIVRTVEGLTDGIAELERDMQTPTLVTKMASMSRLIDQFVRHDEILLIASYAILKAAGSAE